MGYISDKNWEKLEENFKLLMPIILILLVIYMYLSFISTSNIPHIKIGLEIIILVYFLIELIISYINSNSFMYFIKNHWLKIILILPFLRVFRVFGVVGNAIRYVRFLPYMQKFAKLPKMFKVTKFVLLLGLFKLSIIKNKEKIKKEKEKIKKNNL